MVRSASYLPRGVSGTYLGTVTGSRLQGNKVFVEEEIERKCKEERNRETYPLPYLACAFGREANKVSLTVVLLCFRARKAC